jgi:hypothetical protein
MQQCIGLLGIQPHRYRAGGVNRVVAGTGDRKISQPIARQIRPVTQIVIEPTGINARA